MHAAFGEKIDLHSGGIDLEFPHHENEIAQSEALNQASPWCPFFLHVGHLNFRQEKMSKSLGNTIRISVLCFTSIDTYPFRTLSKETIFLVTTFVSSASLVHIVKH